MSIRPLRPDEHQLLITATLGAFNWNGPQFTLDELERSPYLDGWPDFGLVAEVDEEVAVGVAWWRFFTSDAPGYGFVSESVPELCIWVTGDHRGFGIGTCLLAGLIEQAQTRGLPGLSLNVEEGNPARVLYERFDFVPVDDQGTFIRQLNSRP